ncbi:MAG: metallophosphoesterase [Deltaproteobacteria bacterium]|nr:metallophosphoesterase [Deltaproteobacteria bacterium]
MRLLVTSDVHLDFGGHLTLRSTIDAMVSRMAAERPDALVLAGDLAHGFAAFEACLDAFAPLGVPTGVVAGNHDVWRDVDRHVPSRALWETELKRATRQREFAWLEEDTLRVGSLAVIGSLVWYDYSAALPDYDLDYALVKRHMINDANWIDWPWGDADVAEGLREGLVRRLALLETDPRVDRVLLATHVPIFSEQLIQRPDEPTWQLRHAFFGNLTTGRAVLPFEKLRHVVSGHTHAAAQGTVDRSPLPPIQCQVIGSEYGAPTFVVVEL